MSDFTPWTAAAGGALIGLAACLLLGFNGRIAGVSGALRGLIAPSPAQRAPGERLWRALFLLGLVLGAGAYALLQPAAAAPRQGFPLWALVLGGLLTGFGTSRANGCTSGHGVCGLARLSVRSLAAVGTFLAVALATTYVCRHLLGLGA